MIKTLKRDIAILTEIFFFSQKIKRNLSTTQIAKLVFNLKGYEQKKFDNYLRKMFKRWERIGVLISEEVNGRKYYSLNSDKISFFKDGIQIDIGDNFYIIYKEK